jgi:hypothetical protein
MHRTKQYQQQQTVVSLTWWFLRGLRGDLLVEGALSALNRLFLGGW